LENLAALDPGLPVAPNDLEKLARWVPKKEMALLIEVCVRAQRDPDLARPALLLCSAYAERIARMLDQDPIPDCEGYSFRWPRRDATAACRKPR
jgi:hypothetical protein